MSGSTTVGSFLRHLWMKVRRQKPMDANPMETQLNRCLTTSDLVLLGMGHMAGSGIYVVTGTVMLNLAGPATVISYLLGGIIALLMGLCYAQFSVNIPRAGTCYVYIYLIGGELLGFLAGWNLLLDYTVSVAAVGRSLSAYLNGITDGAIKNATEHVLGADSSNGGLATQMDLLGPAAILLVFIVIALGARVTAHMNNIMVILNVIVITTIVIAGMSLGSVDNITKGPGGFFPYGFPGVISGMGVLFFAYIGFDAIATASEETKNPGRSLPVAFCVALSLTILMYCSASFALSLLEGYNKIIPDASFPNAFTKYDVTWTKFIIAIGATIGLSCSLLGQAYVMPRGIYALATDGLLFRQLMYVNSWTKTPLIAIIISTVLSALLTMLLPVDELIELVSIGLLFAMSLMIVCLMKIHYMPVEDCPFELVDNPTTSCTWNFSEKEGFDEKKPILERPTGQALARIGKLRFQVQLLKDWNANTVTSVAITLLAVSLNGLACTLALTATALQVGRWWAIMLLVTTGSIALFCICILLLYEHNTSFAKFKVPLFPWIPLIALFFSIYMMASLAAITWLRLLVWIVVGLVFYFSYGIRHSVMAKRNDYRDLDAMPLGSDTKSDQRHDDYSNLDAIPLDNAKRSVPRRDDYSNLDEMPLGCDTESDHKQDDYSDLVAKH